MSLSTNQADSFGTLRSFLWPIHGYELKKFLPMQLMLILICFNYSILRNLKDSIVITNSGAEVIPFIKMWVLLPMAILMTLIFSKLCNRYSQERVFYIMISIFLVFFALFGFILYPMRETFHPHATAQAIEQLFPSSHWFVVLYEHWIYTLFYVMSELWAAMILNVCFWGFANEITPVREARRFYGVFGIGSNLAAAVAGLCSILFVSSQSFGADLITAALNEEAMEALWEQQLGWMMAVVIISGLLTIAIFRWINVNVLTEPCYAALHEVQAQSRLKGKKKQSLRESFNNLKHSRYLICIAVMVIAYNLSIHLVELVWKDQLKQLYPAKADYMKFLSFLTLSMGIIATLTAFFMPRIISRLGWTFTAMITPITMMITSASFFAFLFFREALSPYMIALLGTTPLAIAVYIGFAQNCFSKAAKYSVFDATTQMSFIPLDHEAKLKGKAAIDGIGSRLGKSSGSLIHTGLLMIFHTLSSSSPYVAIILLAVIVGWIFAVKSLGIQFGELTNQTLSEPDSALTPTPVPAPVKISPILAEG